MEAWMGLVGAIVGAFVGWALSELTKAVNDRRRALKNLENAAFVCLDRLLKIQNARSRGDESQCDKEVYYLGGDLNKYRDAIAECQQKREAHWTLYRRTIPLLLEHNFSEVDVLIAHYEKYSGTRWISPSS
jgi:hypothetical protein